MSGVDKFFSTFGVFNVSGLTIVAAPNSKQNLSLYVYDAVDLNKPTTQKYLANAYQKQAISEYVIEVDIVIRGCLIGEGLKESGACY